MSKEKITLDMQVTPFQFRQYTFGMLKARGELSSLRFSQKGSLPKSEFVKRSYVVTSNQEWFEECFSREVSNEASEKARRTGRILRTLLFAAYIVFYCIYWNAAGRLIDDGWFLFIPFAFVVIAGYIHDFLAGLEGTAIKTIVGIFLVLGVVFPIVSLVKAGEASPAKGEFITVSIIVYFACMVAAIVFYWISVLFLDSPIEKKLKQSPRNVERYNYGIAEAQRKDKEAAEALRRSDERRYQEHLESYNDMMSRKDEIEAEWARYEELYKAWCGSADIVELAYPDLPKGHYTQDELIKRGAEMVSRHVTGTHTIMDIFGKELVKVACDLMQKNMM